MKRSRESVEVDRVSDALAFALRRAIRAERVRAGLSQIEVAARMGLARSTYQALETGARDLPAREIPALCRALGVPFSRLLVDAPAEDRAPFEA